MEKRRRPRRAGRQGWSVGASRANTYGKADGKVRNGARPRGRCARNPRIQLRMHKIDSEQTIGTKRARLARQPRGPANHAEKTIFVEGVDPLAAPSEQCSPPKRISRGLLRQAIGASLRSPLLQPRSCATKPDGSNPGRAKMGSSNSNDIFSETGKFG